MPRKGYSKKDVTALGPHAPYKGRNRDVISFSLGGIGTGSVGLSGRGGLVDWEIFNRPNVGSSMARTFPIIWAKRRGADPVCRILQAPAPPPHQHGGTGGPTGSGEGLPHMDDCVFRGEYPFAWVDFESAKLPVAVALEAYNPFIPGEPDDSGLPAAILRYTVTNGSADSVDVSLAWSMLNMVGTIGNAEHDPALRDVEFGFGGNTNIFAETGGLRGLVFASNKYGADHPRFGSMALMTPHRKVTVATHWLQEGWFTPMHEFWDTFSATGTLPVHDYGPSPEGQTHAGALGLRARLKPRESREFVFYLAWHFPNFEKYWGEAPCCDSPGCGGNGQRAVWKNHYASRFADAEEVALKLHKRERKLREKTRAFHDALFGSTFPPHVLDAVSSQMAILKTATCLRLADGTFYGFEGCANTSGCCEGSCTHVWNYQQALPFLFPSLERSMREADYGYNMREDGGMCFRLPLPLGSPPNDFHACGDGQMGGVIKTYRDWKIGGDDAWLRRLWPDVRKALEYAWVQWDADRDGVMEGVQHNTYDIEFRGPNPLTGVFYLAALEAGARMAEHLGEEDLAAGYRALAEKGREWIDGNLFNGAFYVQKYDPDEAPRFQFGDGCLSDQLLGQWLGSVAGLGRVLPSGRIRRALKSVFRHNWKADLSGHANAQRVYALNDEAGLLLCSWPNGGRPAVPFIYSDEVWTGIEYQVASHLIQEGMVAEGLAIVKGARDRHDGHRRNPWNEFECGHHYARAMASWGLVLALSGFSYDKGRGYVGFDPAISRDDFRCFWSLDGAWGTFALRKGKRGARVELRVLHGALKVAEVGLPGDVAPEGAVRLPRPVVCRPGKPIMMDL